MQTHSAMGSWTPPSVRRGVTPVSLKSENSPPSVSSLSYAEAPQFLRLVLTHATFQDTILQRIGTEAITEKTFACASEPILLGHETQLKTVWEESSLGEAVSSTNFSTFMDAICLFPADITGQSNEVQTVFGRRVRS
jgi:hypothetical protein